VSASVNRSANGRAGSGELLVWRDGAVVGGCEGSAMIIVAGFIDVDPADREAFLADRRVTINAVRTERGCLEYAFSADAVDPARVRVFEAWESAADLDEHLSGRHRVARPGPTAAVRERQLLRYEVSLSAPLAP
jgi:quinol monooxygenase YgiN